jgi:hypothetical protein
MITSFLQPKANPNSTISETVKKSILPLIPSSQTTQRKRPRSLFSISTLLLRREVGSLERTSSLSTSVFYKTVMKCIKPSSAILSISSPSLSECLNDTANISSVREQSTTIVSRDGLSSLSTSSSSSSLFHITSLSFNTDGSVLLVGDSTGRLAIFGTDSFFSLNLQIRNSLQPRSQIAPIIHEQDITVSPLHKVVCPGPISVARWHPKRLGLCAVICYGKRDIFFYDMTSERTQPVRIIQRDSIEPIGLEATFSSGNTDFIFLVTEEASRSGPTVIPATVLLIAADGLGRIRGYDTRTPPKAIPGTPSLKPVNGHLWTIDISESFRGISGLFDVKHLWVERLVKPNDEKVGALTQPQPLDSTSTSVSPLLLFAATKGGHVSSFDLRTLSRPSFGSSKPRPSLVCAWSVSSTSNEKSSLESVLSNSPALPAYSIALNFENGITSIYDLFTGKVLKSIDPSISDLDKSIVKETLININRLSLQRPNQYPLDRGMLTCDTLILLPQTRVIAPPPITINNNDGKTTREIQRYFRGTEGARIDNRPSIDHDVLTFLQFCGQNTSLGQKIVIKSPGRVTSITNHPVRWDLIVLGMCDGEIRVMQAER